MRKNNIQLLKYRESDELRDSKYNIPKIGLALLSKFIYRPTEIIPLSSGFIQQVQTFKPQFFIGDNSIVENRRYGTKGPTGGWIL